MPLILDSYTSSTHQVYHCIYHLIESKPSYTHEARPIEYDLLDESESKKMLIAYAAKAFEDGWDLSDEEENNYWDNL